MNADQRELVREDIISNTTGEMNTETFYNHEFLLHHLFFRSCVGISGSNATKSLGIKKLLLDEIIIYTFSFCRSLLLIQVVTEKIFRSNNRLAIIDVFVIIYKELNIFHV